MILCLEFQECFSPDFCPPVLGTPLLISELTGVGLNSLFFFFSLLCCSSSPELGGDLSLGTSQRETCSHRCRGRAGISQGEAPWVDSLGWGLALCAWAAAFSCVSAPSSSAANLLAAIVWSCANGEGKAGRAQPLGHSILLRFGELG